MSTRSITFRQPAFRHGIQSSGLCGRFRATVTLHSLSKGVNQAVAGSLILRLHIRRQQRYASNLPPNGGQIGRPRQAVTQPTIGAILRKALDFSWIYNSASRQGFRRLFRDSPEELVLALALLVAIGAVAGYVIYLYFNYFNAEQFTKFPPPIANSLRRALYYTNIKPDSNQALKYYKQALEQCTELGLDPFSDEVLGIRIQVSFWLEKIGNQRNAIFVLSQLVDDCLKWNAKFEQALADGTAPKSGVVPVPAREDDGPKDGKGDGEEREVELENLWRRRTRLLVKAIQASVKLGELHADEHIMEPEISQARLSWAVETALKELARRTAEGEKEVEGPWMSKEELGGALEALGRSYEKNSQFQLAVPLFFQALRMCESPCHRPVLMNNLAVTFAQHPPLPILTAPLESGSKPTPDPSATPSRGEHLQSALNWARNAYTHAKDVSGEERTIECDEACAVALCNLGDILAMLGQPAEARERFEQCIDMSKAIDFPDGVNRAQAGLERVK